MLLKEIIARTENRVAEAEKISPLKKLEVENLPPPRDFIGAIKSRPFTIIAELKKASPSKGKLRPDLDAGLLAQKYAQGGAAALSVLTEPYFFEGSLEDLREVREACPLPILRKDFIISPYQVYESRFWGADAVLLIVAILSEKQLKEFLSLCRGLKLAALVEVHSEGELYRALDCGAELIGINNRDLNSLVVDPEVVFRLRPLIPQGIPVVAESGISTWEEIERLKAIGVQSALIGEALVTAADPERKLREFLYGQD